MRGKMKSIAGMHFEGQKNIHVTLILDNWFITNAAEMPLKFQSNWKHIYANPKSFDTCLLSSEFFESDIPKDSMVNIIWLDKGWFVS